MAEKERGTFEGPIRISLRSLLFLFNALALLSIPSKSLKFRLVLFSTPTRFRQSPDDSTAFVGVEAQKTASNLVVLFPSCSQIKVAA